MDWKHGWLGLGGRTFDLAETTSDLPLVCLSRAELTAVFRSSSGLLSYHNPKSVSPFLLFQGKKVKGLIILNPGNPTGDVFDENLIREALQFCHE